MSADGQTGYPSPADFSLSFIEKAGYEPGETPFQELI